MWNPLVFLVFFLTLRARGMRTQRKRRKRQTRGSSPSPIFMLLLTSLFTSSSWRTRLGRRRCATLFPCLLFLVRFVPFWARIPLDNSLLLFWAMRVIHIILLMASFSLYILKIKLCHFSTSAEYWCQKLEKEDGALGSKFTLSLRWENTTFDRNRYFMKLNSTISITSWY